MPPRHRDKKVTKRKKKKSNLYIGSVVLLRGGVHDCSETILLKTEYVRSGSFNQMNQLKPFKNETVVIEGGGAVGIAALLTGKVDNLGKKVAVVISGSNVSLAGLMDVAKGKYPYQISG